MEARTVFKGNRVDIYTSHALALNCLDNETKLGFMFLKDEDGDVLKQQSRFAPMTYKEFANNIKVNEEFSEIFDLSRHYKKVLACVEQYFYSASIELSLMHLNIVASDYVDQLFKKKKITSVQINIYKDLVIDCAKQLAELMLNPKSNFPTNHDAYVKYWQLSNPKLNYDYIMIDEAQDSSSVLLAVILRQDCQRIYVGDKYQSINQWRGCINAMDIIPCKSQALSNAFRYGQKIADLATKILRHDNEEIQITGLGFNTEIVKGSEYNDPQPILFIANSNESLQNILLESYQFGVPAKFVTNKASYSAKNLASLLSIAKDGKPLLAAHKEYSNIEKVLLNPRSSENRIFAELIKKDLTQAESMLRALEWSLSIGDDTAKIILTTAHGCKGLEYDNVMLSDDFYSAINAFGSGKPIQEEELYLLYVAVTRPRKTLILPDELYNALEKNLAFKINKNPLPPHLLDNLLPTTKPKAEAKKPEPESKPEPQAKVESKKNTKQKVEEQTKPESSKETARDDTNKTAPKASSSGQQNPKASPSALNG
jgi:superfamily I DNA/RNA helicase